MHSLRRFMAITLLALSGSQPAAASCVMIDAADRVATAGSVEQVHAHHAGVTPDVPEAPPADRSHSDRDSSCDRMMPCAVAAPTEMAVMPAESFNAEASIIIVDACHAPPALVFEPPPPRNDLI